MIQTPPDWDQDKKLWELLGKSRPISPASNFLYEIRQKLVSKKSTIRSSSLLLSFLSWSRGWSAKLVLVAACATILLVFIPRKTVLQETSNSSSTKETVQLVQLAQNYELIQDFEVIENLDKL